MEDPVALMTSVQNRYDQLYNDESSSRAHQESDEVFGLQNDNRYPQYVRRALHERSTNTQYENLYRLGAFDKSALLYPAKLPPSGPLVLDESAISVLSGWSSAYEKEFRIVWHQSWECKAFYEYRTANPKPDRVAKDEDKKWTPLREEMFFRALCKFPPVGREKARCPRRRAQNLDKQYGRNELVADCINEWLALRDPEAEENKGIEIPTEEIALSRKQISSHLQVLKGKFLGCQFLLDNYFARVKKERGARPGTSRSTQHLGRLRSQHHMSRSEHSRHALAAHARPLQLGNMPMLPTQSSYRQHSMFEPSDFTGNIPELSHVQDCPVIHAHATMQMPSQPLSAEDQQGLELSIDSTLCSTIPLDNSARWYVRTRFFEGGQPAVWTTNNENGDRVEQNAALQPLTVDSTGHGGMYRHSVPFGSPYWVMKVSKLNRLQSNAASAATGAPEHDLRAEQKYLERIKQEINCTSAVQEIFARAPDDSSRRCLVIYWKFEQTTYAGETGVTVFRNLHMVNVENNLDPADNINIHLHHHGAYTSPGIGYDMLSHDNAEQSYSNSSLDALATVAFASAPADENDFYDFDWQNLDSLLMEDPANNGSLSLQGYTLAGAEAFDSFADLSTASYGLSAIDAAARSQAYDPQLGGYRHHPTLDIPDASASHSSVASPSGDMSYGSDYHTGSSGESLPSTAASSYVNSAQFTPASFQSQFDFAQQCQVLSAYDPQHENALYPEYRHAQQHHHQHHHEHLYHSPQVLDPPVLRSSTSFQASPHTKQPYEPAHIPSQDMQDDIEDETLQFVGDWNYAQTQAQRVAQEQAHHYTPAMDEQYPGSQQHDQDQHSQLPHTQYKLMEPMRDDHEEQTDAGAAGPEIAVANMYDASNFFAGGQQEADGRGVWEE